MEKKKKRTRASRARALNDKQQAVSGWNMSTLLKRNRTDACTIKSPLYPKQ